MIGLPRQRRPDRQRPPHPPGAARQSWTGVRSTLRTGSDDHHHFLRRAHATDLVASRIALAREQSVIAKLQELDHIRDAFVSTISHELRTPLTSILGFLHLVMSDQGQLTPADRARMLGIVQSSSQDLLSMVDDLLTLPQLAEGLVPLKQERLDLVDVLYSAQASFPDPELGRIGFDIAPGQEFPMSGDFVQLTRAFINLLSNAIKFTPADGTITMTVQAGTSRVAPGITVTIEDTGIGIPVAEQGELFNRFFRSSVSQEYQTAGMGIGLTIAAAIVRGHHGQIKIESAEGAGTTVRVWLPTS